MKKIIGLVLFGLIIGGCQQKGEERKPMPPLPSGPVQARDSVALAQEAVKADPGNVNAWIALGNIMMDTSRFNEAVDAYQKALEIDPKNVDVRVDMGTCYRNSGKPDRAVQEYRKALDINPNHPNGHLNLAVVLENDFRDNAQAVKEFERYLQLAPNAPNAEQIRQKIQHLKASKQ